MCAARLRCRPLPPVRQCVRCRIFDQPAVGIRMPLRMAMSTTTAPTSGSATAARSRMVWAIVAGAAASAGLTGLAVSVARAASRPGPAIPAPVPVIVSSRPDRHRRSPHWWRAVVATADRYIYEPVATVLRLLHLLALFGPVVVCIPAVWLGRRLPDGSRSGEEWWFRLLVAAMARAGASFIKLGQWAASRTDVFPSRLCDRMSSLHSSAPPHSTWASIEAIERAFGDQIDDVFISFDPVPVGTGAIAQVHRARLRPGVVSSSTSPRGADLDDAELDVAVKVLHPLARRTVRRDLRLIRCVAAILNSIPTISYLSFPQQAHQFAIMMDAQLNLATEAANLNRFQANFADRPGVTFPAVVAVSGDGDVLIEQFAAGIPLGHFLCLGGGVFEKQLAASGLTTFLNMMLVDNFIHTDLHPGNIIVHFDRPVRSKSTASDADPTSIAIEKLLPIASSSSSTSDWTTALSSLNTSGLRPQLVLLDAGLATELSPRNRASFLALFSALANFDGIRAGELMIERSRAPRSVINPGEFAIQIGDLVKSVRSHTFALANFSISSLVGTAMGLVRSHHVQLDGDFVNLIVGLVLVEGIGRTLDPDVDLFAAALPILRRLGVQATSSSASAATSTVSGKNDNRDKGLELATRDDLAFVRVWAGLEARSWFQAAAQTVEWSVKADVLAPNV